MKKYALVVGVSKYADPEITDLSFAARDAEDISKCLVEACGFHEVRTLVSGGDSEPDHVNVVDALHHLAPRLSRDDLFLFYFAGHGIETQTGAHLLTSNSRIYMPELASVSKELLTHCLSRVECADRVLILDVCRSDPRQGMGGEDNLLTSGFSPDIMAVAETSVDGVVPSTCVLFSCRLGERAYEWPDMGHGAFAHYLLEGLRGAAADDNGRISIQALGRYVEAQVSRWARKTRKPRPQSPWGEQRGSWREIFLVGEAAASATRAEPTSARSKPKPFGQVCCPYCDGKFYTEDDEEVDCPNCAGFFTVGDDGKPVGRQLTCPYCKEEFYTEDEEEVNCPNCDTCFILGDDGEPVGREVTCPHCGEEFYTECKGQIDCPDCSNSFTLSVAAKSRGGKVTCPHCEEEFYTEANEEVHCPACTGFFTMGDDSKPVGAKAACPYCKTGFYTEEDGPVECPECFESFTLQCRQNVSVRSKALPAHIAVLISDWLLVNSRGLARASSGGPFMKLTAEDIAELCKTLSARFPGEMPKNAPKDPSER